MRTCDESLRKVGSVEPDHFSYAFRMPRVGNSSFLCLVPNNSKPGLKQAQLEPR